MSGLVDEFLHKAREAVQHHQPAEGERLARRALEIDPDHYECLQLLGATCIHQGKLNEGVVAMKHAAAVRPEDPRAQFNLGSAYALARRWNEANAAFQIALQLDPDYHKAREALGQAVQMLVDETRTSLEGGRANIYCQKHPDVQSVDKCRQCGALVCEECVRMDYGTAFCEPCYREVVQQRETVARKRQSAAEAAEQEERRRAASEKRGLFGRRRS